MHLSRRLFLTLIPGALVAPGPALAEAELRFSELYGKISVVGLEYSSRLKTLSGQRVSMRGYMAPPLKAEAKFFVLGAEPMSICPFCSSDADWPDNIVVVYLDEAQTFSRPGEEIRVTGMLEVGSWVDPETGFVSRVRLRSAVFDRV